MAAFATLAQLATKVSLDDLAEVAAPDDSRLTSALLSDAIHARDIADSALADAAAKAIKRLQQALDDASTEILGYLSARYPKLSSQQCSIFAIYCLDIAIFRLFGGDAESERARLYQQAQRFLSDVATGKLPLASEQIGNTIAFSAPAAVFDAAALADY